ncbi:MAG TPA: hypothetical protein VNT42_02450, partial [Sphingomonas sp.]|nr:hypothetical protein [Sphingomonas sp.]
MRGARWLVRPLLLVGLAFIAIAMVRSSLGFVLRSTDPALALRFDPDNAAALAARAEQLLRDDPSEKNRILAEALARRALRRSPVSADGARMLATTRDMAGDEARARQLMDYSQSLSRRDFPTQIWFIEDAIGRNDIAGALRHYDIALRTSAATKALLFPVLIKATAQPAVAAPLIDTLAARPLWADPFLEQASREAPDPEGLARLIVGLARRHYPLSPTTVAQASARIADR